jgi:hypothetical protein
MGMMGTSREGVVISDWRTPAQSDTSAIRYQSSQIPAQSDTILLEPSRSFVSPVNLNGFKMN